MKSTTQVREPIFWTSTQPGFNDSDRTRHVMIDGERVTERIPQRGHVGDHDEFEVDRNNFRYRTMIRHDGHIVSSILTNGAAHSDVHGPYGQYIQSKYRFLGWFSPADCPCALIASRIIGADTMVHAPNRTDQPCEPGTYSAKNMCPHAKAEIEARRARQKRTMDQKEKNFTNPNKAIQEQQAQMIAGQNKLLEVIAANSLKSSKGEKKD